MNETTKQGHCSECGRNLFAGHADNCSRNPDAKTDIFTPRFNGGMTTAFPWFDDSHLRALRLWHWKEFLKYRRLENKYQKELDKGMIFQVEKRLKENQKFATLHIKAVQTLNDCFAIGDTAESDAAK